MTGDVPEHFLAEERSVVEDLCRYAADCFGDAPDLTAGADLSAYPQFTIALASWPHRVEVFGEQFLHIYVGRRQWELGYDDADVALARRILLGASRGEFRRFRPWRPGRENA